MSRFIKAVRTHILTGILLLLPLITTVYIFIKLFDLVDSVLPTLLYTLIPGLPLEWIPGVGILLFVMLGYIVGVTAKNYVGKLIIDSGNKLISNIPIINKIYGGVQQLLDAIFSHNKKLFEKVVLIEYPKKECWSLGFITSYTTGEVADRLQQEMVSVFVPTTPNPTSGFLLFLPPSQVQELDMSIETAVKMIMSAGMVNSDQLKSTQSLYANKFDGTKGNWWHNLTSRKGPPPISDPRD
jgi:uncharacterized membrane protein